MSNQVLNDSVLNDRKVVLNDLLLRALKSENDERAPVWLMRQAGRYMQEYRSLREKYTFLDMCHEPDLIAKVTRLPIDAFGMDAAILFSDILLIPEAFGVGLSFEDKKGPVIHRPIRTKEQISSLRIENIQKSFHFVEKGIKALLPTLNVPLIGFSGAPFTVASYMIEGGSSPDFKKTKQWMIQEPESFHQLLDKICDSTIDYLKLQIEAGVHALQIFDSWANCLSLSHFREFSLFYLEKILSKLGDKIPVILFSKGSFILGKEMGALNPACISVDSQVDLALLRQMIPPNVAIQGNLDPDILYGSPAIIKKEVTKILEERKGDRGFIFNLAHGIKPDMKEDSIRFLVDTVKEKS